VTIDVSSVDEEEKFEGGMLLVGKRCVWMDRMNEPGNGNFRVITYTLTVGRGKKEINTNTSFKKGITYFSKW
jgi:hypothetical protein